MNIQFIYINLIFIISFINAIYIIGNEQCNLFIKFNKSSYDIIRTIHNNPYYTSIELETIIKDNNLIFANDIEEIKTLVLDLFNSIHTYCLATNNKNTIQFKTIPAIIEFLNNLNSSQ